MSNPYNNQYNNHEISQADFIRNFLSTNSMKQFWYEIDECEIIISLEYSEIILSRLANLFSKGAYFEDRTNIVSRITYLRNGNKNENNTNNEEQYSTIESTGDLLLNSISSFAITVSSQGGNPKFLYEDYKLKEFFQCLAKNGIEVSFKVKKSK